MSPEHHILSDILSTLHRTEDNNQARHVESMLAIKGPKLSKDDEDVLAGILAKVEALSQRLAVIVAAQ